jgi:hypothetical protein
MAEATTKAQEAAPGAIVSAASGERVEPLIVPAEIETHSIAVKGKIQLIRITDQASLEEAADDRAEIKRRRKLAADFFAPICDAAHKVWKTAVAKRDEVLAPYDEADKAYSRAMGSYEQEQTRIREEEARRVREETERLQREEQARAAAERKRLEDQANESKLERAVQAEERGDTATADRILEEPVVVPPVAPRPIFVPRPPTAAPPPAAKGVSFRDNWKAEVVNLLELVQAVAKGEQPITYLQADMPAINAVARALKDETRIPGVTVKNERLAPQRV